MIHRCRVHLLPGHASMINRPRSGRSGQTPGPWEQPGWAALMAKKRRKTLVVCAPCHEGIHAERTT